jgi:hypothetical protein
VTASSRILIVVATALLPASLFAQQPAPAQPDSDLRCAAWAAVAAGANEDNPEAAAGFSMAMVWFAGRYEGATAIPFEQSLTADYLNELEPELAAIEQECLPRILEMGERFERWGAELMESALQE